jgi:hypothetical protein
MNGRASSNWEIANKPGSWRLFQNGRLFIATRILQRCILRNFEIPACFCVASDIIACKIEKNGKGVKLNFRTSIGVTIAVIAGLACLTAPPARAQANPGDPLFCDPNEGIAYLIVNGGSGIFTVNSDCYGGNSALDTQTAIATGQGGSLNKVGTSLNYIYTPPNPTFTGQDTFSISVTTVCNRVGGTGSAGGATCPGGPATLNLILNVIPATSSFSTPVNTALIIPIPPGSISGCSAVGNGGNGPVRARFMVAPQA